MEENKENPAPQNEPADAAAPPPVPKPAPAGPRKILEALEAGQDQPAPAAPPAPPEKMEEKVGPEEELLIPESMRKLEQVIKEIKEKATEE